MVDQAAHFSVLLADVLQILSENSHFLNPIWLRDLGLLNAKLLVRVADNSHSGLSVSAQKSQTSWQNHDFIPFDVISFGLLACDIVEVGGPVFVAHSRSPVSGDFDCVEKLLLVDVNVGNDRQPASHADTCDVQRI